MNKEFTVHLLNDEGKTKANAIAQAFDDCLEKLILVVPAGRELAIVRTKLEEASFFAKKGMATLPVNCVVTEPVVEKDATVA